MSQERAMGSDYDVAVVGGGLVGATLAYALASQGWRVAVLEAIAPRAESQPSYDDRTLALSDSSCRILSGLGLWPELQAEATPIRRVIVRELDGPGRVELDPAEHGLRQFGHVVEARAFGAVMMRALPGLQSLEMLQPASVTQFAPGEETAQLDFEFEGGKRQLQARLVVGADGAASFIRQAAGLSASEHDYGQTAVICNITPEEDHRGRAFECFTPTGPLAVLPHRERRCGLVWSLPAAEAEEKMNLPDDKFMAAAQARFGNELGAFGRIGRRSSYPLRRVTAAGDIAARTVIMGNAAHTIHPIGAQGFNLGLRDVAVLAELLADLRHSAGNPGDGAVLQAYHDWRAGDQAQTTAWSDVLARLYASDAPGARLARSAGLIAHRLLPSLRKQTAARAMGYRGRIPRLALGERLDTLPS